MIFTRHFGALAARPTFIDAREMGAFEREMRLQPSDVEAVDCQSAA